MCAPHPTRTATAGFINCFLRAKVGQRPLHFLGGLEDDRTGTDSREGENAGHLVESEAVFPAELEGETVALSQCTEDVVIGRDELRRLHILLRGGDALRVDRE